MTAPIELSLFRLSIRRHTTQLCEHHLTRRPDRRKLIEFTEKSGSKKYVIFINQKLNCDRAQAVCCGALGRDCDEAADRALITDGRFRGEAEVQQHCLGRPSIGRPIGAR
jgi:hypothetical protein